MVEKLDAKVARMPRPKFNQLSNPSTITFTSDEEMPVALTINWQWVLGKISQALTTRQSGEVIKLLATDLDYLQLTHNAINDIQSTVSQQVDENVFRETRVKISLIKQLIEGFTKSLQSNNLNLHEVVNKSDLVISQLQSLGVVGVGAFMLTASLQLALLQEQAKSDSNLWRNIKARATDYSNYGIVTTPKLIRFSVGQIDKSCQCARWESRTEGAIAEYECRYCDGKDIHIFRETSPDVINTCNKHRLQMFQAVTDRVNNTAVRPIRAAAKQWREWALSI